MRDPVTDLLRFLAGGTRWGWWPILFFLLLSAGSAFLAVRAWRTDPEQRAAPVVYTAAARYLLGAMWFQATLWKLPPWFTGNVDGSGGLPKWTGFIAEYAAYAPQRALFRDVVLANFQFFAWQVWAAETLIGAALILGLFTRAAALMGALMAANLWLGLYNAPHEWAWTYVFMILLLGFLIVLRAGRALGADALLSRRPPSARPWLRRLLALVM